MLNSPVWDIARTDGVLLRIPSYVLHLETWTRLVRQVFKKVFP